MKMNACENFEKKRFPKKVMLDKSFAGAKAGQMLYVGTPQIVADYIAKIPPGKTASIPKMRNQIARRHNCDAMCPVSTAIFLRIAAEYAIDEMENGKDVSEVLPFWRVIEPGDKVVAKLAVDGDWIAEQRAAETEG